jgi:hypothetical protein
MAKQATVNVSTVGADIGYGISALMTLLLANGWTLVSAGTGTAGVRRTTPALSLAEWIAATNTWQIVARGSVWLTIKRNSATSIDVRFAVAAPATVGSSTVADSQVTAANETTFLAQSITGSSRAHAITVDNDDNAAGIRSFYLVFTNASFVVSGVVVFGALVNGSYTSTNPAPYVVSVATTGAPFVANTVAWRWWYSLTSVWTASTESGVPQTDSANDRHLFAGSTNTSGVDPWNGKDVAFPLVFGRTIAQTQPGFVGAAASILGASVNRGYPNTTDLATDARVYVGTTGGSCLIPWADGVVPL